MTNYQYPKNKRISIFIELEDGSVKKYIHPLDKKIKAYIRELSSSERNELGGVHEGSEIECVINRRKVDINMFVEFCDRTYQISSVDNFEFDTPEIKIRAYQVAPKDYDRIEGSDW